MHSLDLQPTNDNLFQTFADDCLDRNGALFRFVDVLDCIDSNCVIALDSGWGSGKTFFVKQAKMILDAFNPFGTSCEHSDSIKSIWTKLYSHNDERTLNPQVCVYYDAWENDTDDDPLLSLVYNIMLELNSDYNFKKNPSTLRILASISELLTGKKIQSVIDSLTTSDPFSAIKDNKNLHESVNDFFESLLPEKGTRLIVFVDELDRCNPSYAVRLLERIKHYFCNERITFVLSVNTVELQSTVRQYYGQSFDACKYLDRFFDLRFLLPPPNMEKYLNTIGAHNSAFVFDKTTRKIVYKYKLSLRETAKYVRMMRIAINVTDANTYQDFYIQANADPAMEFGLCYILPLMLALRMFDREQYDSFIQGKDVSPLLELLDNEQEQKRFGGRFLSKDETFDNAESGRKYVRFEDRVTEVYRAIIRVDHDRDDTETTIGKTTITRWTRQTLLNTESLLSGFSRFN